MKENENEDKIQICSFPIRTEVPKATREEMKGNLQFFPQAGEDLR